jgi:hypothetical protein
MTRRYEKMKEHTKNRVIYAADAADDDEPSIRRPFFDA